MAEHGSILNALGQLKAVTLRGEGSVRCSVSPSMEKEAWLLLQAAMKCSDLGHVALGWEDHLQWVHRLEEEFFRQGDLEKEAGLQPISFLMDRTKPGVSKTQVGFCEFIALPQFRALAGVAPSTKPMMQAVTDNYERLGDL